MVSWRHLGPHDPSSPQRLIVGPSAATSPLRRGGKTRWADGSSRCRWRWRSPRFFLAPLLLLVGVSFYNNDKIAQPGFGGWIKFFGDPFNYKVIADTLLLGVRRPCAPPW